MRRLLPRYAARGRWCHCGDPSHQTRRYPMSPHAQTGAAVAPLPHADGTLVTDESGSSVFLVENGALRHVPDAAAYHELVAAGAVAAAARPEQVGGDQLAAAPAGPPV